MSNKKGSSSHFNFSEFSLQSNPSEFSLGLYNPESEGKVFWICGYDEDKRLTSVFCYRSNIETDKLCDYLENEQKALEIKEELVRNGWKEIKSPEITFSSNDDYVSNKKES